VIEFPLKDKIKAIDKQMGTTRVIGGYGSCGFGRYTNVGKSTMNAIGKSDVLSKTSFSPLYTTVRKVVIKTCLSLSDTVGFIRKLPTTSRFFKST
jgi:50S ribosomal subunit-associated GTPase HflX